MKSFAVSFVLAVVGLLGVSQWLTSASSPAEITESHIGPDRKLGIVFANCESYGCGFRRIRYCYYGVPFISQEQEICWANTHTHNFIVNSLRAVGRAKCGYCD